MPRHARLTFSGAFHHVFNRGIAKQPIFIHQSDYQKFLTKLKDINQKFDHRLFAYCLMPNHFHLCIHINKTPLAKVISSLSTSYSMHFNLKYHRVGPLFQNRYKSTLVNKNEYFLELSRYIHLNPVRDELVSHPASYPYSSYQEIIGQKPRDLIAEEAIERLIGDSKQNLTAYQKFVEAAIANPKLLQNVSTIEYQHTDTLGDNYFRTRAIRKVVKNMQP